MGIVYSLDTRCQNIIHMMLNTEGYLSIKEIAGTNNVSARSIYYDIAKINEWLAIYGVKEIVTDRSKGVLITKSHTAKIKQALEASVNDIEYLFTPTQRVQIMILAIIKRHKPLFIEDFTTLCKVSRNTIINDLKVLNKQLSDYQLLLRYENKVGYVIQGDFVKKASLFFLCFNELSDYYRKGIIELENKAYIYQIDEKLNQIESELGVKYVSGVLFGLATFCAFMKEAPEVFPFESQEEIEIKSTLEYRLVEKYFSDFTESFQMYMTLHLLGSRLQTAPLDLMLDNTDETYELACRLVQEFSNVACVSFEKEEAVVQALFGHLKTSLYRYKYGIQLANPMFEEIKQEYYELFELTKKACKVLSQSLGVPIPDGEIAYMTLHFGGFIVERKEARQDLKILIVCPNGVSTSNMLKAEVHALIPHASVVDQTKLSKFEENHAYDVIISTVLVKDQHQVLVVNPILTDNDRVTILRKCMAHSQENRIEIDEILSLAKPYVSKANLPAFKKDLQAHFVLASVVQESPKRSFGLGLRNHLTINQIQIQQARCDWQEALFFASKPLLDTGSIEPRYVESIVKKCHQMGTYMFITDRVMLAHAGVKDGVNRLGISLATFKEAVGFSESKKAKVILVLATPDYVSHLRILNDVARIFGNAENVEKLVANDDASEVLADLHQMLNHAD